MVLILASRYQRYNLESLLQQFDSQIPLTSVSVQGEMTDFVGHVRLTQAFENHYSNSIEALYLFNLDHDSTVIGMKMKIGDRVLVSQIDEKKEARHTYEKAISEKKTTCLLEKAANGIFKVNVGNILPSQKIEIEIEYLTQLSCTDEGEMKFVLPTNISPKYDAAQKTAADRASTLAGMTHTSSSSLYSFHVDMLWRSNNGIKEVKSLTNEISVASEGDDGKTVRVRSETAPSFGDFNLFVTVNEINPTVYVHERGDNCYLMVNHRMGGLEELSEMEGGDFTILVDRSGSMGSGFDGWSGGGQNHGKTKMDYAREATRLFVQSLPAGSRFNVVSFGSSHQSIFPSSVDYSNENKDTALKEIERFKADLGGTELYRCLQQVLSSSESSKTMKERVVDLSKRVWSAASSSSAPPPSAESKPKASAAREKIVILMTDGDVGNVDSVVGLIRQHREHCRVFTIGIGSDVNRFLCEEVAAASNASCEILVDNPNISTVVAKMLDTSTRAYFQQTTVQIVPGTPRDTDAGEAFVQSINKPLYANKFLSIFLKFATKDLFPSLAASRASLRLSSKMKSGDGEERQLDWNLAVDREQERVGPHHRFIPQLYAADLLRSLENESRGKSGKEKEALVQQIVRVSCEYQVMNDRTSFVVVDESSSKDPKASSEPVSVSVPQYADEGFFDTAFTAQPAYLCSVPPPAPSFSGFSFSSAAPAPGGARAARNMLGGAVGGARLKKKSRSAAAAAAPTNSVDDCLFKEEEEADDVYDLNSLMNNDQSDNDEEGELLALEEEIKGGGGAAKEKNSWSAPSAPSRRLQAESEREERTKKQLNVVEGLLAFQNVDGSFPYSEAARDLFHKHAASGCSSSVAAEERVKSLSSQLGISQEVAFNAMVLSILKKDSENAKYVMIIRKLEKWIDKQLASQAGPTKKSGELLKTLEGLGSS